MLSIIDKILSSRVTLLISNSDVDFILNEIENKISIDVISTKKNIRDIKISRLLATNKKNLVTVLDTRFFQKADLDSHKPWSLRDHINELNSYLYNISNINLIIIVGYYDSSSVLSISGGNNSLYISDLAIKVVNNNQIEVVKDRNSLCVTNISESIYYTNLF